MNLYYQAYPESLAETRDSRPPIVIIPGLFGSTTNWRGFARKLSEHWPVYVIDQRNHGKSPHADSHTYSDMCDDLLAFCDQHGIDRAILAGHSMGGKTAMVFSLLNPDRVAKLAVLDIAPVAYPHTHAPFLEALMDVGVATLGSRAEAERAVRNAIPDTSTRLFLLQSLTGSAGAYKWRLNLPALHEYMSEIVSFPNDLVAGKTGTMPCCFIYGEASEYVRAEYHEVIQSYFPNASFAGIAEAGHWLHIEQPERVMSALLKFVNEGEK